MAYEHELKPLRQVQLSTLSPVMWAEGRSYPRQTISAPIHPYNPSIGGLGSCCGGAPHWNRSNSIANLRPIGFGTWSDNPLAVTDGSQLLFEAFVMVSFAAGGMLLFELAKLFGLSDG